MDEAMNPLTLLTVGLYGQELPKQDGAPVRIIIPWKYGFKSAKSIVEIKFVEKPPHHLERRQLRRIRLLLQRQPQRRPPPLEPEDRARHRQTLLRPAQTHPHVQRLRRLQVASLYNGMDLRKYY
jgi:sulfoxide reductase catalytic subunit YedY